MCALCGVAEHSVGLSTFTLVVLVLGLIRYTARAAAAQMRLAQRLQPSA